MKRWWTSSNRPVAAALLLGCCLHVLAMFTNDLGLDAHVRLNATFTEAGRYVLPWGGLRHADGTSWGAAPHLVSMPWMPWLNSSAQMKAFSFMATVVLVGGMVHLIRQSGAHAAWYPLVAVSVVLSPVWMFSTGRGYDEALLALLMLASLWWVPSRSRASESIGLRGASLGVALGFVLALKGLDGPVSMVAMLAALVSTLAWRAWWNRSVDIHEHQPSSRVRFVSVSAGLTVLVISVGAYLAGPGSFASVGERPLVYLASLVVAALLGGGLYLGVGCMLWPIMIGSNNPTVSMNERSAYLWCTVGALGGAIVCYTAVLWTYESGLWEAAWWSTVVRLGNNGRYMTLLIPLIWGALAADGRLSSAAGIPSSRTLVVALLLVMPFTAVTAAWGHQVWSDDAGRALNGELHENSTFLLVAEPTLAMHHLYVMRTHIDGVEGRNITGAWATPSAVASSGLNLQQTDALVVGPNTDFSPDSSWVERAVEPVPFSVPIIQTGAWRLYTKA